MCLNEHRHYFYFVSFAQNAVRKGAAPAAPLNSDEEIEEAEAAGVEPAVVEAAPAPGATAGPAAADTPTVAPEVAVPADVPAADVPVAADAPVPADVPAADAPAAVHAVAVDAGIAPETGAKEAAADPAAL